MVVSMRNLLKPHLSGRFLALCQHRTVLPTEHVRRQTYHLNFVRYVFRIRAGRLPCVGNVQFGDLVMDDPSAGRLQSNRRNLYGFNEQKRVIRVRTRRQQVVRDNIPHTPRNLQGYRRRRFPAPLKRRGMSFVNYANLRTDYRCIHALPLSDCNDGEPARRHTFIFRRFPNRDFYAVQLLLRRLVAALLFGS